MEQKGKVGAGQEIAGRPLDQLQGRFFELLQAANRPRLDGFRCWLLQPGMLFKAQVQWWGLQKPRPAPHEGLDLRWFRDEAGHRQALDDATVIPVPFSGIIGHICGDFLGQSIFVDHDLPALEGGRLVTALGHTRPRAGLAVGQRVEAGEVIAAIFAPENRRTTVPAHLHITLFVVPDSMPTASLTWEKLDADSNLILLDPLAVFPTAYLIE